MILPTILRRRTFRIFAKQTAEIVAVDKAAAVRHLFNFQVITLQQRFSVFQSRMVQVFVKADGSRFLEQMREVIWRDIKRLRHRFARQRRGVVFINIFPDGFKKRAAAGGGLDLATEQVTAMA